MGGVEVDGGKAGIGLGLRNFPLPWGEGKGEG